MFHRLALEAIKEGQGSLVWLSDKRISAVATSSIDKSTVDLNRGEMSFSLFDLPDDKRALLDALADSNNSFGPQMIERLTETIGDTPFPKYVRKYIGRVMPNGEQSVVLHRCSTIEGYADGPDINKDKITRKKGFFGKSQMEQDRHPQAVHHLRVFYNGKGRARLFYKFAGSIVFIQNTK
jgi:hypothetical protein